MRKSYITLLSLLCGTVISAPHSARAYDYISHSGVSSVDVDTTILNDELQIQTPEQAASAESAEEEDTAPLSVPPRASSSVSSEPMPARPVTPVEPAPLEQKLSKPFFTTTTLDAPEQPVAERPARFPADLIKPHAPAAPETPSYVHKSAATAPQEQRPVKPVEAQQVAPPKAAAVPEIAEITPEQAAAPAAPAAAPKKSNAINWLEPTPTALAPVAAAPVAVAPVAATPAPAAKELSPVAKFVDSLPAPTKPAASVAAAAPVAEKPVEAAVAAPAPVAPVVKPAPAAPIAATAVPEIPAPAAPKSVEAKVTPPVTPVAEKQAAEKPVAEIVDTPPPDEPLTPVKTEPAAPQPVAAAAVAPKAVEAAPKTVVAAAPAVPAKPDPLAPIKPTLAAEKIVTKPAASKPVKETDHKEAAENIDAKPALPVTPVEAKPIDTPVAAAKDKTEVALNTTSPAPAETKAAAPKTEDVAPPAADAPQAAAQPVAAPAEKTADKTPAVPSLSDLSLDFDTTSSNLTPAAEKKLDALASQLEGIDDIRLQIRGFAKGDGDGQSSARRMALSRVLVVRSYLMDKGIKPIRLDVQALGSETDKQPIDRVDLVFVR